GRVCGICRGRSSDFRLSERRQCDSGRFCRRPLRMQAPDNGPGKTAEILSREVLRRERLMARKIAAPPPRPSRLTPLLVCGALAMAVAFAYGDLCSRPSTFASIDDGDYIVTNQNVQAGLTPANVYWAFTTF